MANSPFSIPPTGRWQAESSWDFQNWQDPGLEMDGSTTQYYLQFPARVEPKGFARVVLR